MAGLIQRFFLAISKRKIKELILAYKQLILKQ